MLLTDMSIDTKRARALVARSLARTPTETTKNEDAQVLERHVFIVHDVLVGEPLAHPLRRRLVRIDGGHCAC